ncbi:MAG TPA: STAS domain-containing protein [Amycolatopsis sp.]|nr:STAS domain-containing protein [Amycolatopsis sp.]
MTTIEPFSWPGAALAMPGAPAPVEAPSRLRLTVTRPDRDTAVLAVAGELDASTAPRLSEVVMARLRGTLHSLVVDLSKVDFLAAAGISVLVRANLLARHRGVALKIATGGNRHVSRALAITGMTDHLVVDERSR